MKLAKLIQAIMEKAPDGFVLLNSEAKFKFISPSARKIFGYDMTEKIPEDPSVLTHPDDLQLIFSELGKLFQDPSYIPVIQYRFANKQGEWIWIESTFRNLLSDPNVKSIVINFRDITDRRKDEEILKKRMLEMEASKLASLNLLEDIKIEMEQRERVEEINRCKSEELRLSEEKFKNIFELAPVGKSMTTIDGIVSPNKAFCNLLGYTKKELKCINWRSITFPDDIKKNDEIINSILKGEKKTARWEKRYITKVGKIIWVDISTTLLRDSDNNPLYFITTLIDITDKKRSEEKIFEMNKELERRVAERTCQLENANKELEAFAYSVSHDLRAPLRAIDGFSKFVLEDYSGNMDPEGQRLIGLIRSNTKKMDNLILDILALSRVTRSEHRKSKIDMTKMAVSMFNESITNETKENLLFIIDQVPDAFGDPTYLKIVWSNLILNAIKFSSKEESPEIKISGYARDGFNVYCISDNGVGFNPEYGHKLFGVFQRLHKSDEFEGTGVGLAIVQRIVHRHGGEVWGEGKTGEGATFSFSLPVKTKD